MDEQKFPFFYGSTLSNVLWYLIFRRRRQLMRERVERDSKLYYRRSGVILLSKVALFEAAPPLHPAITLRPRSFDKEDTRLGRISRLNMSSVKEAGTQNYTVLNRV